MRFIAATVGLLVCVSAMGADAPPQLNARSVLILPLSPIGDVTNSDWIGSAVQQNLFVDLTRHTRLQVQAPTTQPIPAGDLDAAKKAAVSANAGKVIFGSYQLVDGELRLSGQMFDLIKGEYLGSFKATGPMRDLFQLEDTVAGQMRKLLVSDAKAPAAAPAAPPAVAPQGPLTALPLPAPMPWEVQRSRYRYNTGVPWYFGTGYYLPGYYGYNYPYYCAPTYGGGSQIIIIQQGGGSSPPVSKGPKVHPRSGSR